MFLVGESFERYDVAVIDIQNLERDRGESEGKETGEVKCCDSRMGGWIC